MCIYCKSKIRIFKLNPIWYILNANMPEGMKEKEMIDLLLKRFIKDYDKTKNPEVRTRYGVFAGIVGIICNLILFLAKIIAGVLTASVSIMADAVNNLSDAGSSIVTLIGFKLAGKPADYEHPYGHGRIEYISGFIVSGAIIIMGFELLTTSFRKILHPTPLEVSVSSLIILVLSILMKMWMAKFNKYLGNKVDSAAMKATATDSLSDCVATSVVLIGVLLTLFSDINIDGIAGVVVAVFVILAGFGAAKDTLQPLLGQPPTKEYVQELQNIVLQDKHIIGVHDLIVHNYGPGRVYASLHAEVPANMDMMEAHDYIDMAERRVEKHMKCFISIHMDPVVTDDEVINHLRKMTIAVVKSVGEELDIHDFRTVKGPYITNLIFDVLVPYNYHLSDDEIKKQIQKKITEKQSECRAVINIDKSYTG